MKRLRPFLCASIACLAVGVPSIAPAQLQESPLVQPVSYPDISSPIQMGDDVTTSGRGLRPVASSFGDLVLWEQDDKLYANAYDEGVVRWNVPIAVADLTPGSERAFAASSSARVSHLKDEFVVWEKDGTIFGRAVRTDGTMGAPIALSSTGVAARPRISTSYSQTGTVTRHFVVWQQSGTPGIWANRVTYENGSYRATTPFRIFASGTDPDISCNSSGDCVAVFRWTTSGVMVTAVAYNIDTLAPSNQVHLKVFIPAPGETISPASLAMPRVGGPYRASDFAAAYLDAGKVELERIGFEEGTRVLKRLGKITSLDAPRASVLDLGSDLDRYAVAFRARGITLGGESNYVRAAVFDSLEGSTPRVFNRVMGGSEMGSAVSIAFKSWHGMGAMWVWDATSFVGNPRVIEGSIIDEFNVPGERPLGSILTNPVNNTTSPRLATDRAGNSLLVWLDDANKPFKQKRAMAVLVDRFNDRLTAPFVVSDEADDIDDIDVAWNGYDYMVVMTTTGPTCKVVARAIYSNGTTYGNTFGLRGKSSGCARSPRIVKDVNERWFNAGWITDEGVYTAVLSWHLFGYRLYSEYLWPETQGARDLSLLYHAPEKSPPVFYMAIEALDYNLPYIEVYANWGISQRLMQHEDPQLVSDGQNVYLFSTNTQKPMVVSHRVSSFGDLDNEQEVGYGYLMPFSVAWNGHTFTAVTKETISWTTDILLRAHVVSPGWYGLERRGEYEIGTFSNRPQTQVRGLAFNGFWDLLVTSEKDTAKNRMTSRFRTITRLFPGQPCSDDTECLSAVCLSPINACQ